jgi:glyoxylase-like metal-dependent hydrolase (beta-lactamase superfamily II)
MTSLYIQQLQLGPMKNFVYLVGAAGARETAIIDAAWDVEAALAVAAQDGREVTHALVTHHHHDHTNGLPALLVHQQIPIYCHEADIANLDAEIRTGVEAIEADEVLQVGPLALRALHTPGHTPGSVCWSIEGTAGAAGAIFSGDTLFVNTCGRCDFAGGDPRQMRASLLRLRALDPGVTLYPGHDYGDVKVSTIGRERAQNPYFQRLDDEDAFVALRMQPR